MMSSEVKQLGVLHKEDGTEVPFFTNDTRGCSEGRGCIHSLADRDSFESCCAITDLKKKHGMRCMNNGSVSFYVEKPAPTQAELVRGYLAAGEYVMTKGHGDIDGLWTKKRVMSSDGSSQKRHLLPDPDRILHHGDALSTIRFLCEQGYEVEFEWDGAMITATSVNNGRLWGRRNGSATTHSLSIGSGVTITRFYRPAPAESDAQKILRLADEGNTVEYKPNHNGNFCVCDKRNGKYWLRDITDSVEECEASELAHEVTYLAHYREPEPEDVLRAMDGLTSNDVVEVFPARSLPNAEANWERLSDYYAIARWKLIESNPDNNVSLD